MDALTCTDSVYSLYNGGAACRKDSCGPFSKCLQMLSTQAIETTGCCRKSVLYPNFTTIFVYILIIPVIGIGSLGALGGYFQAILLGGTVKRPFLQAILNFDASIAGDITSCLMFSAQLVNMIFIFFQTHPEVKERPVINFEIALIYTLSIPISMCLGNELSNFLPLLPLLSFQVIFFLAISPILIYYGRQENIKAIQMEENNRKDSALLTVSQVQMVTQSEFSDQQAKLYRQFYEEQCQKFPLIPISITLVNFTINELLLLLRSSPYQYSPYFFPDGDIKNKNSSKGPCEPWNFYMILLIATVNLIISFMVYYYMRKRELLKNTVNFYPTERYFTPVRKFFLIYSAGMATGFVAGFIGMAAGLMMVITMTQFKLIPAVAGATANYCYFLICIQVFTQLIVGVSQNNNFPVGEQFFFYALGCIAVLTFTNYGYYILKKRNVGHLIFYIDFSIVILNIIGNIVWGVEQGDRFGFSTLEKQDSTCGSYVLNN